MPPHFFGSPAFFFRNTEFFLPTRSMDAATAGILRDWAPQSMDAAAAGILARPHHLPPPEISDATSVFFGAPTFFHLVHSFFSRHDQWTRPPQVFCEAESIGAAGDQRTSFFWIARFFLLEHRFFSLDTINGRGRRRYFARLGVARSMDMATAGILAMPHHLPPPEISDATSVFFGAPAFLIWYVLFSPDAIDGHGDVAAAGIFERPRQLPPKIFLKGTTINLCRLHLGFYGMPFTSFGIDFFFRLLSFSLGVARRNVDASAANPSGRMICFLLMLVGRLIVF